MKYPSVGGMKKITLFNRLLTVALITVTLLVALAFSATQVAKADDPMPQSVTWRSSVTLYDSNGITSSPTGSAKTSQADYGIQDCYQIVDATLVQTVTGSLQHSPDGVNWVTLYSFSDATTDTVAFTRTAIYGGYERYVATLGTANPVTVSLKCTVKDN